MLPTKYYSYRQEHGVANYLGWEVVTGSGARDFHPGDIITESWLGECKTHTKFSSKLRFNADVWKKIVAEAQSKLRYPVLFTDDGSQKMEHTWCVYPYKLVSPGFDTVIVDLNIPTQTNLIVVESDLATRYRLEQGMWSTLVILKVHLGNQELGLVPLESFKRMFGN